MKKRIIALLLAVVMLFALSACKSKKKVAADEIEITILSHPSWPYQEDWKIWDYIEEGTGYKLSINAIPSADYKTKYPLIFASPDTLPDVISFDYKPDSDKYVDQGAFIALDDRIDELPNYKAWLSTLSAEDTENIVNIRKAADGKIYYAPVMGREANRGMRTWLYRKDIFDKHGLTPPTTFDELYEVCKALKAEYPDSFPLGMRSGLTNFAVTGSSWKEYWEPEVYYDYNSGEWCYGASEEILKDMIIFYRKMVDEKLMPADFISMNATSWQELIITNKGFIMPEYQTRISFFNSLARESDPNTEFNLTAMAPPVATASGAARVGRYNYDPLGYAICNTGDEARISKTLKFIDWFYTDEAMELCSWGKEGETYTVNADGKKEYIKNDAGTQIHTLYGFTTHGSFLLFDPEATLASMDEDTMAVKDLIADHTLDKFNPKSYLAFNKEETKIIEEYQAALKNRSEEMITNFILGNEPLSNFDAYIAEIKSMGVDKLLSAYESAYNRVK